MTNRKMMKHVNTSRKLLYKMTLPLHVTTNQGILTSLITFKKVHFKQVCYKLPHSDRNILFQNSLVKSVALGKKRFGSSGIAFRFVRLLFVDGIFKQDFR